MENTYSIEETFKTLEIKGNIKKGFFHIKGRSLPENAKSFYLPFRDCLKDFYNSNLNDIKVILELAYYNTASSKIFITLLLKLNELKESKNVQIDWRFDEDDLEMEETGLHFKNLFGDSVRMRPITN
jgi:hypothetical protein